MATGLQRDADKAFALSRDPRPFFAVLCSLVISGRDLLFL